MRNIIAAILFSLFLAQHVNAKTGADLFVKYYKDVDVGKIDEYSIKAKILEDTPIGTNFSDIVKTLKKRGINYNNNNISPICFPADDTPLYCQFKSSKKYRGTEPDYSISYIFNENSRLKDVIVVRSFAGRVKRFTTNPTQPAINLSLKNNISIGSKIKDFDVAYGEGHIEEGPDIAEDWPLSIRYFDNVNNIHFYVGVDVNNMSWDELKKLKQYKNKLREYKAGIIYIINNIAPNQ